MRENVPKQDGASRCVHKLPNSYLPNSYIVIAEAEIGSPEHQAMFLIARIQVEKAAEEAYRNHSSEALSSEYPDTHFEELAVRAWERYQQQRLQEAAN
jgi:hypothetical protein